MVIRAQIKFVRIRVYVENTILFRKMKLRLKI